MLRMILLAMVLVATSACSLLPHHLADQSAPVPAPAAPPLPAPRPQDAGATPATPTITVEELRPAVTPPSEHPCDQLRNSREGMLDMTRRELQERVCSTALWFDGLFGERDVKEIAAARQSYGRAELATSYSQFNGTKVSLHFNAHMDLPHIKHRLSVFVGRDTEDSFVRDRSESFALRTRFPHLEDRDETIAGLGYSLPESYHFKTEFRSGVRFAGLTVPKAFAQVRFALNAYADDVNLIDLRATPFYNTRDQLGLTVSGDYSRVLADSRLFRWSNTGTITQKGKAEGVDWRSALILYQGLTGKRAIALETFVRGGTSLPVPLSEYGVQVVYRQPLANGRLFGEAVTGYSWPKADPALQRKGSYAIALILELPFGEP